jgi:hypothetical protein
MLLNCICNIQSWNVYVFSFNGAYPDLTHATHKVFGVSRTNKHYIHFWHCAVFLIAHLRQNVEDSTRCVGLALLTFRWINATNADLHIYSVLGVTGTL